MSENSKHTLLVRIGWSIATIVWVGVAYIGAILLAQLILTGFASVGFSISSVGQNAAAFLVNALVWSLMLPLLVIPPLKLGLLPHFRTVLGLTRLPRWMDIGLAVVGYIPYLIISLLLNGLAVWLLIQYGYNPAEQQDVGFSNITTRGELLLAFGALVVLAPLVEEIIFRGFLYSQLKRRIGLIGGIITTSIVFGVLHMQLNVGIDVFALSIVLCILREITGSIWAGVLLHSLKNGLAFSILFIFPMIQ